MQIYIHHNNQQTGPFTEAEVRAQLAAGTISPQDSVWWQGQAGWVTLAESSLMNPGATAAAPAPGLPPASAPQVVMVAQPASKLALWALICGCGSFLCGIFAAVPAIILGHMSLAEIKKNPALSGRGMALAGLIIGYIVSALSLVYIAIVIISVVIALGNQVKTTAASTAPSSSTDSSSTNSDQSTNSPDQPAATPAPASSSDSSSSSPTATPVTNAPDSSTNAAPASQ